METRLLVLIAAGLLWSSGSALGGHDSITPSAPRGVTGHGLSDSSIELMWWPSQDNAGIDHYNIYRCQGGPCTGTLVGTSLTNYFRDTGLSPHTEYSYTVSAVDTEGRESNRSIERDGYSQSLFTHPTGGNVAIVITNSPQQVSPTETFGVSWRPTLNPTGTFGHHDAHFNDSLDNYGCNPPNCWYEVNITTTALPSATLNSPYSYSITHNASSEAVGPFACGISQGRLPNNLLFNSSTCTISGTPTQSGSFAFIARVKAASENYAMQLLTLTVGSVPDTMPPSPPTGLTVQ